MKSKIIRQALVGGAVILVALFFVSMVFVQESIGRVCTTTNPGGPYAHQFCKGQPPGSPNECCNIFWGYKTSVWLDASRFPDGVYFFAVLSGGGAPDANDGGPRNLSDDYDVYTNRIFTVIEGLVEYEGTHEFDDPLISPFPYADTISVGGVYIMAVCNLDDGYPVDTRSCSFNVFRIEPYEK